MRRLGLIWWAFCALVFLVACGGGRQHHHGTTTKAIAHAPTSALVQSRTGELAAACPPGASAMGCAVALHPSTTHPHAFLNPLSGPLFPDVYEGQRSVAWGSVAAWQRAHGWPTTAMFKLGEFRLDNELSHNSSQTLALHFTYRFGYWFVRDIGCQSQADKIISTARANHIALVALDLEVPEAHGYGFCLSPPIRRAHLTVIEYTSPGSNPGGVDTSDPLWIATFGPGFSCIWTCNPVAWQFTDGKLFMPVNVPGVGFDDVNIDLGITKLAGPPPDPYKIFPRTVFSLRFGVRASEHGTVATWYADHCSRRHLVGIGCKSTYYHARLERDREWFVVHHKVVHGRWVAVRSARWGDDDLGGRFYWLSLIVLH